VLLICLAVTTSLFRLYQGDTPPNLKNNQLVKVQLGLNKKNAFIKVNGKIEILILFVI
jgi:general stress protein 26